MTPIRNEFAETIEELLADCQYLAIQCDFCEPTYGGNFQGKANAETLDVFMRKHLSARHIVAYTLAYAKRSGRPLDKIEPREVADAMAAEYEQSNYAYIDKLEAESEEDAA